MTMENTTINTEQITSTAKQSAPQRDDVNEGIKMWDLDAIRLRVASPDDVHDWSHGEVVKPETINYRTQKPERDGLFCERIFGPEKDWECYCGKYKRVRYKGIVCDKCGVEVTKSVVRRERFGHIDLATPVTHIWFLRGVPSRVGLFLNMSVTDLEKVVYFASFIITSVDEEEKQTAYDQISQEHKTKLNQIHQETERLLKKWEEKKEKELDGLNKKDSAAAVKKIEKERTHIEKDQQTKIDTLEETVSSVRKKLDDIAVMNVVSENYYQDLAMKFGHMFEAGIGAETIYDLLTAIHLDELAEELEKEVSQTQGLKRRKAFRRLRLVKSFIKNKMRPEWMVLTVVPVIPPDLRPMVRLDGGRHATSDLNDLYRRVINRNNRLKRLKELNAPEVIQRNEKRMLQESADALFDNSARRGKTTTASTGQRRELKSLADYLKGKQGRFRQNLLGKRIDYSGRSVIVVGPKLKMHQCGLPKLMALELFRPFVMSELIKRELVHNIRSANKYIEAGHDEVWEILENITKNAHVMLNRAPTLHRLGIQAFQPVLVEGKAIQLHPLVCPGFNADFDGDQMAVHVPITDEAKKEAAELMLSSKNLLKPAAGDPVTTPAQDLVLGCYYLTKMRNENEDPRPFSSKEEALSAYELGFLKIQEKIVISYEGQRLETTVGRLLFNEILPESMRFVNKLLDKKALKNEIVARAIELYGIDETAVLLDKIKDVAFKFSTLSGVSFGIFDLPEVQEKADVLAEADTQVEEVNDYYQEGLITDAQRYAKVIKIWKEADDAVKQLSENALPHNNSIAYLILSGARGSMSQLKQVIGIKGSVVSPTGELIEVPIRSSLREGTGVLEYFIATHGVRKGLSDTALKTANAGFLTRKLCDVAQDVVVTEEDCGTTEGFVITQKECEASGMDIAAHAFGRYVMQDITDAEGEVLIPSGTLIDTDLAKIVKSQNLEEIKLRTVLNCKAKRGVCRKCYGYDLGNNDLVKLGTAVGIIAAQSIGEPGTQLTMRTFHTGGVSGSDITTGLPRVEELFEVRLPKKIALIAEVDGKVRVEEENGGKAIYLDYDESGEKTYHLPKDENVNITVKDGQEVNAGDIIYVYDESGREISASVSGKIKVNKAKNSIGIVGRGKQTVRIALEEGQYPAVQSGELVHAGQRLTDGSVDIQELFKVAGKETVQRYIIQEIQKIYSAQASGVSNKHLEVIIRQMLSWAFIEHEGDTELLPGETVSLNGLREANRVAMEKKGKPAQVEDLLLGITKASLSTDSWLSAASFIETARILINAATSGKVDYLQGLKENVIIGRLIPAGTGFDSHKKVKKGKE